jgi:hypothetical protein
MSTPSASSEICDIEIDDEDFMVVYIALECMGNKGRKKAEIPMTIPTRLEFNGLRPHSKI